MNSEATQTIKPEKAPTGIFVNRQFLFVWMASIFSGLALSIYILTETWYILKELKQPVALGIIMMLTTIPRLLLMSVGGVLADRMKRSTIMFLSNSVRSSFIFILVGLLLIDAMNIWLLGVFALLYGILDAFFWPAASSMLPQIVGKEQLVKGNSVLQTTNQLTLLLGPIIAGFIIELGSFPGVFAFTAIMLLISTILIRLINEKIHVKPSTKENTTTFFDEFKEGIQYVKAIPFLVLLMGTSLCVNFFLVGPLNIGLPLIVDQKLNGNVLNLSYLESSLALGMIAGAILIGVLNIKKKRAFICISTIGLLGICSVLFSRIEDLWQGIAVLLLSGICLALTNILSTSLVQEVTDPAMIGRIQSLLSTAAMGFIPVSLGIVSLFVSMGLSITTIILYAGSILTVFIIILLAGNKLIWSHN